MLHRGRVEEATGVCLSARTTGVAGRFPRAEVDARGEELGALAAATIASRSRLSLALGASRPSREANTCSGRGRNISSARGRCPRSSLWFSLLHDLITTLTTSRSVLLSAATSFCDLCATIISEIRELNADDIQSWRRL